VFFERKMSRLARASFFAASCLSVTCCRASDLTLRETSNLPWDETPFAMRSVDAALWVDPLQTLIFASSCI
jgi:hypothetical protein